MWTALTPQRLFESDSCSLNFKIISIHSSSPGCHLSSQSSAAVRRQWEWFQGVNGLNLVLFVPSSLFPSSVKCETFAVVRRRIRLSVQEMWSNCATVQTMSSRRRTLTSFPKGIFPTPMPSVNVRSENLWHFVLVGSVAGYVRSVRSCMFPSSGAHFLARSGPVAFFPHACCYGGCV